MPRIRSRFVRCVAWGVAGLLLLAALVPPALYLTTPSVDRLVKEKPSTTALMEQRRAEAGASGRTFRPRWTWTPLERITPRLAKAVIVSEDSSFYAHHGFDWEELQNAAGESMAKKRLGRGASTLTQQLAKNLWLGTERSLWRKAREAVLTIKLERTLPKRRILTLYLNVVEWGNGAFGAEAAAHHWFGATAGELSTAQAVVLASMLPAPRRADLKQPPRWLARRSRRLLDRMLEAKHIDDGEYTRASAELEQLLAGPAKDEAEEPPEEEDTETADSP